MMSHTYARVRLAESLQEGNVHVSDSGSSGLLVVLVEPQVVGPVTSHVELVSVEILVIHIDSIKK